MGKTHARFNYVPTRFLCLSPNPYNIRMSPYLENEPLQSSSEFFRICCDPTWLVSLHRTTHTKREVIGRLTGRKWQAKERGLQQILLAPSRERVACLYLILNFWPLELCRNAFLFFYVACLYPLSQKLQGTSPARELVRWQILSFRTCFCLSIAILMGCIILQIQGRKVLGAMLVTSGPHRIHGLFPHSLLSARMLTHMPTNVSGKKVWLLPTATELSKT